MHITFFKKKRLFSVILNVSQAWFSLFFSTKYKVQISSRSLSFHYILAKACFTVNCSKINYCYITKMIIFSIFNSSSHERKTVANTASWHEQNLVINTKYWLVVHSSCIMPHWLWKRNHIHFMRSTSKML